MDFITGYNRGTGFCSTLHIVHTQTSLPVNKLALTHFFGQLNMDMFSHMFYTAIERTKLKTITRFNKTVKAGEQESGKAQNSDRCFIPAKELIITKKINYAKRRRRRVLS